MENLKKLNLSRSQVAELSNLLIDFYVDKDNTRLQRIFEIYDRDRNGAISAQELKIVISSLCQEPLSDDSFVSMIREGDHNRNGLLEFEEFKSIMIRRRDNLE